MNFPLQELFLKGVLFSKNRPVKGGFFIRVLPIVFQARTEILPNISLGMH